MDSTPPPYNRRAKSRASPMALQDLLQLPSSPLRRSAKTRLDISDEIAAGASSRRRLKACPSPRNVRRSRRRSEAEEKDSLADDLAVSVSSKPRKRRHSIARSNKDKLALIPFSSPSPKMKEEEEIQVSLDRICQGIEDLVMWTDASRSSLWFGLGSLFFFSSCFTHGVHFSAFSVISKIGLMFLGAAFFSNSMRQRNGIECKREYGVKEEDLLRIARLVLPFANVAMSKTRGLFSGDPSTTLKVAPMLLLGSEYGHIITLWRLCAIGFFYAFTVPKIYSFYSIQISQKVTQLGWRAFEAWGSCHHKKVVAASAVTAFWNLSTVKTRIFAAFMCLVLIRYCREHISQEIQDDKEAVAEEEQDDDKETLAEEEVEGGEEKNIPSLQQQELVLDCPNKQQSLVD